jgi:hypothetical protein
MKLVKTGIAAVMLLLLAQAAYSQCCCSGAEVAVTDGAAPLPRPDVKITQFGKRSEHERIVFREEEERAVFQYYVGCGDGKEALTIEYKGLIMRIRFKLHGDFGGPKGEVVFSPGDFVAELVRSEDGIPRSVVFRDATPEEMEEIEPPATDDQTVNPL